jgi:hypothetical protein
LSAVVRRIPREESHVFRLVRGDWPRAGAQYEQRYPPLDFAAGDAAYLGVTVVRGGVRLSRPKSWALREASNEPGRAFIQYISPSAYSFAIYERPDARHRSLARRAEPLRRRRDVGRR